MSSSTTTSTSGNVTVGMTGGTVGGTVGGVRGGITMAQLNPHWARLPLFNNKTCELWLPVS